MALGKVITPLRLVIAFLAICVTLFVGITSLRYASISIPVLVTPVASGTVVTAEMIGIHDWPLNGSFPGLVVDRAQLIGKTALVALQPNQPLSLNLVGDPATANGGTGQVVDPRFPNAVPDDQFKFKVYVPVDLRRSGGGVINPGDYVDVVQVNGPGQASTILQKIHVVRAMTADGFDITPTAAGANQPIKPPAGLVLALTQDQAQKVISLDPTTLYFIYTVLAAPDLPNVPSGAPRARAGSTTPTAAPTASPVSGPASGPTLAPAPSAGQSAFPLPVITPGPAGPASSAP